MISKQKLEKILAFTLAEILITMIIITLMTLASVPVIKKSKEGRETAKDKNSWAALYEATTAGNQQLVVYDNGTKYTYPNNTYFGGSGDDIYAKFTPPAGVSKFNVTVIGGGGGGGAGMTNSDSSRIYIADPANTKVQIDTFVPAKTATYQIIAIGGGGGGGGGAATVLSCTGSAGYSGGAVMANVKMKKGEVYAVVPGLAGYRGQGYTFGDFVVDSIKQAAITIAVAGVVVGTAVLTGGASLALASVYGYLGISKGTEFLAGVGVHYLIPDKPTDGGGTGQSSEVSGPGVHIIAGGGRGGTFRRIKFTWYGVPRCKYADDPHEGDKTTVTGSSVESKTIFNSTRQKTQSGGYICKNNSCVMANLAENIEGGVKSSFTFGNGGDAGSNGRGGKAGVGGYIQIRELPAFGGGGGQAGAVSFYAYERSPIAKDALNPDGTKQTFVKVYVGKGGEGGKIGDDVSEKFKRGQDGKFSRFGERIIADGGIGGDIRVNAADMTTYRAEGENGAQTAVSAAVLTQAKLSSSLVSILKGGFMENTEKINGQGHGQNNTGTLLNARPGSGGGGGGAKTSAKFQSYTPGVGGNGASGAVIVTW